MDLERIVEELYRCTICNGLGKVANPWIIGEPMDCVCRDGRRPPDPDKVLAILRKLASERGAVAQTDRATLS